MTQAELELSGTGSHLTSAELRLWTSFLDAGRIIDSVLAADLVKNHDMSHREYEVLVRLDGAGGRSRMSVLAQKIEASPPLITQTVDRLENRGWVARRSSEEDRRGVEAILLEAGRASLAAASRPHAELIRVLLLDRIGGKRLSPVAEALGDVADHLRCRRIGLRPTAMFRLAR